MISVRLVDVTTMDDYQYDQYWYTTFGQDHTLFKVRACNDPHIILATAVNDMDNVYEVALGEYFVLAH